MTSTPNPAPSETPAPPAKKPAQRALYAVLGLIMAIGGGYQAYKGFGGGRASVSFQCKGAGPTEVECTFRGTEGKGNACLDVVVKCNDGEHVAKLCADFEKDQVSTARTGAFTPPVTTALACTAIDHRNSVIKAR